MAHAGQWRGGSCKVAACQSSTQIWYGKDEAARGQTESAALRWVKGEPQGGNCWMWHSVSVRWWLG